MKRRLSHSQSIRVSKMMHLWLNLGHQKMKISKIEKDGICPCCGTEHEDQDHLFKCENEDTRLTMRRAIREMEETLIKENLPPGVRLAFMEKVRRSTNTIDTPVIYQCDSARKASEQQDRLGSAAILRGHHHVEWVEAIFKTYKPRVYPPNTPKKNKKKDKSALELSAILVRECWNLFEKVWKTRNDKVHDTDGILSKTKHIHLTEELMRFKQNATTLLHYTDHNMIDYPENIIHSWKRSRKEKMIALLTRWHKRFVIERRTKPKGQKSLTDFFGYTITRDTGSDSHSSPCPDDDQTEHASDAEPFGLTEYANDGESLPESHLDPCPCTTDCSTEYSSNDESSFFGEAIT